MLTFGIDVFEQQTQSELWVLLDDASHVHETIFEGGEGGGWVSTFDEVEERIQMLRRFFFACLRKGWYKLVKNVDCIRVGPAVLDLRLWYSTWFNFKPKAMHNYKTFHTSHGFGMFLLPIGVVVFTLSTKSSNHAHWKFSECSRRRSARLVECFFMWNNWRSGCLNISSIKYKPLDLKWLYQQRILFCKVSVSKLGHVAQLLAF